MDVDSEYSLVLRFALLNDGLPYKGFDTDKLTISSSNDLQDLRNAIKAKCAGTLEGIDAGTLKIYATACTIEEATRHLNTMESGERVPLSDWKVTPLPKLALLGETFKEQPKTNSIHLIVDCTAARKFDNSRRLQQGEAKMDISADLHESEGILREPVSGWGCLVTRNCATM
jgi:Crinkler effector protein N-terminal domain